MVCDGLRWLRFAGCFAVEPLSFRVCELEHLFFFCWVLLVLLLCHRGRCKKVVAAVVAASSFDTMAGATKAISQASGGGSKEATSRFANGGKVATRRTSCHHVQPPLTPRRPIHSPPALALPCLCTDSPPYSVCSIPLTPTDTFGTALRPPPPLPLRRAGGAGSSRRHSPRRWTPSTPPPSPRRD